MSGPDVPVPRAFVLSPANSAGVRGALVFRDGARFPLAERLRAAGGAPLGDVYAFVSGLYFRGKLAYARAFANPPHAVSVIVPGRGLLSPDTPVTLADLRAIAAVPVDPADERYRAPLERDARALAATLGDGCAVLLGSIATPKYVDILSAALGPRLRFPVEFVGRGDMSRGGLLLRQVDARRELTYVRIDEVLRRGPRPPRLAPRPRPAPEPPAGG
jgi:hypothetical protein